MRTTKYSIATSYQQSQVNHADPVQLIVMLYDGALSRLAQARQRFQAEEFAYGGIAVSKAQAIVNELRKSLNLEAGGEIAANLDRLYAYIHDLTAQALTENRADPLDEATRLLSEIREAWAEVTKTGKNLPGNTPPFDARPEASRLMVKA
jgi:flagellar protein FliS